MDPVPQILDGVQHVPRERVQKLVGKQIVDVPVPQILEEDFPQAKRPGWWRHGKSLSGERCAPTCGAEAFVPVEPVRSKRAYHQPSRDLRLRVVDYALLRNLQGWDNRMIADHLAARPPDVFQPWLSTRTLR